jgi:hypothetical protein
MMISRLPSQRMPVRLVGRQGQTNKVDKTGRAGRVGKAALVIPSHQKSKVGKKRRKTVLLARSNAPLEMVVLVVAGVANANHNVPSAAASKK